MNGREEEKEDTKINEWVWENKKNQRRGKGEEEKGELIEGNCVIATFSPPT